MAYATSPTTPTTPVIRYIEVLAQNASGPNGSSSNPALGVGHNGNETGDEYWTTTSPRAASGVIVLLLMVLNLMGNGLVFWVYTFKTKETVFAFFVRMLAGLDLLNALTTMLMDVIIKMVPPGRPTPLLDISALCKLTHFQVYANSLISGCILMLIAYQRYRKICHPLQPSIKMRKCRVIVAVCVVLCILLSSSCLVINGPQDIHVRLANSQVVKVTICRYDEQFVGKPLQVIFVYTLMGAFSVVLSTTIVFYVLVARALRSFETTRASMVASPRSPVLNPEFPSFGGKVRYSSRSQSSEKRTQRKTSDSRTSGACEIPEIRRPMNPPTAAAGGSGRRTSRPPILSRPSVFSLGGGSGGGVSSQMYKMFLVITVVFIVSYLPHLVSLILTKTLKLDSCVLTTTQRFFVDVAYNTPYISTVANPLVYGFRSAEFREHCKSVLKCKAPCSRRRSYY